MYLNFQVSLDQFVEKSTHKPSILENQQSFGMLVQNNLIQALYYVADSNNVRIQKTTKDYDRLFGADFKMHLISNNKETNNMSAFIDVTLDIEMLTHCIKFNKGKPLYTLSNGLDVYVGYKTMHSSFFHYKKPIIALVLGCLGHKKITPTFNEQDVSNIIDIVRKAMLYLTFKRISNTELSEDVKFASFFVQPVNQVANEVACCLDNYAGGELCERTT